MGEHWKRPADRNTPYIVGNERDTHVAFLDYLRESVMLKTAGLSLTQLREPGVASGTSLLGLVKHLTKTEVAWFPLLFAGLDVPLPGDELDPDDTVESVLADYRTAVARSNEIVAACADLDTRCTHALGHHPEPLTLRWVLVHMVEETARHAGHADILREQIDGRTGR